jgi:putative ABC transport system permease protein
VIEDLRHATRVFAKHPAYLLTAMLTLAVGIGFTTATFSVLNAVLLRPLPYKDPERLVQLIERVEPRAPQFAVSPGHYLFWREHATAFDGVAAWAAQTVNLDTGSGGPERVRADRVTGNMFALLGVEPAAGRALSDADDREDAPLVAVLSYGTWQRRFAGRADAVGKTVFFDRKPATIVGVMPRSFVFESAETEMWVPIRFAGRDRQNYSSHYMTAVARLKAGVTRERAGTDMQTVSRRLGEANPGSKAWSVVLFDLQDYLVQDFKTTLYVLFGAVSLVLLIACANVANLVLVRGAARQKELAIRSAIGASRRRLLRQLMVEQVALASLSAAAGVLMAAWLLRLTVAILPDTLPLQQGIAIDGRVLGFALVLAVVTPLLFGLLPAWQG